MLHDEAEDLRLEDRPVLCVGLGDGDEIAAEENARNAIDAEQALGQRRARGLVGGVEIGGAALHHHAAGQELQRGRIWGLFGLDEHPHLQGSSGIRTADVGSWSEHGGRLDPLQPQTHHGLMNQPLGTSAAPSLPPLIDGELRLENPAVDRAFRWLLREGRHQPTSGELLQGFCRELAEGGFPLMRSLLAKPTLHPQIASIAFRWSRVEPKVEAFTREHDIWQSDQYLRSPMALIYAD